MNFTIKPNEWKSILEHKIPFKTPVWLKLRNGRIVLSICTDTGHLAGMAPIIKITESEFMVEPNTFYLIRDAEWQLFNEEIE